MAGNLLLVELLLGQRLFTILGYDNRHWSLLQRLALFLSEFSGLVPERPTMRQVLIIWYLTHLSSDRCASISVFVVKGETEGLRFFFNLVALPDILRCRHSL